MMRAAGWVTTIAAGAVSTFVACSDSESIKNADRDRTDESSENDGVGGVAGSALNLHGGRGGAGGVGGVTSMELDPGQGGAPVTNGGTICDRFIEDGNPRTADLVALENVVSTYPGYIRRDCRIRGFTEDIDVFGDIRNLAYDLTMYLWGCEGYGYGDTYDPRFDFPLLHPTWQASEEDVEAFIDAYMTKTRNSGLGFSELELQYFRSKLEALAQGAADPGFHGFTRSRCDEETAGLGGAGGAGGAGGSLNALSFDPP